MAEANRLERRMWREKLSALKVGVRQARIARRGAVRDVRAACRQGRVNLRERQAPERVAYQQAQREARAQFYTDLREARLAARQACVDAKDAARSEALSNLERRRRELDAEKAEHAETMRIRRIWKAGPERATRRKSIEAIAESDDAVIQDLPPELVPVFEKVKREIRATPRMSRTEAFLHWIEENPDEAARIAADRAEHDVEDRAAELEAEELAFKKYQAERTRPRSRAAAERHADLMRQGFMRGAPF